MYFFYFLNYHFVLHDDENKEFITIDKKLLIIIINNYNANKNNN